MVCEWIKNEYADLDIGDKRLNTRLMHILSAASQQPGASFTKLFLTRNEVQASYRFFDNDLVDEAKVIAPHYNKALDRIRNHPVVLHLSDTTSLNYTSRKTNKDSGYISTNDSQGFFAHVSIAITPERLHLGVIEQRFWSREKEKPKRIHWHRRPLVEKESYRWLQSYEHACTVAESSKNTQIVHVSDREGDLFEVFEAHQSRGDYAADFIVRSNHDRIIYRDGETIGLLTDVLKNSKVVGEISFEITKRKDDSKRMVCQTIQATSVVIHSKYDPRKPIRAVQVNAIYLSEIDPPEGESPVIWRLLTSLPIDTIEAILTIVKYYLCRWEIEVFFKTFKSGCKVEEKSLRTADRLYPLFSLFLVIAWRINFLIHMSRNYPEISCSHLFEEAEWKAAYSAVYRTRKSLDSPPTLAIMMGYVARLGGYQARKNDPPPGPKVIWAGLCRLSQYADAWELFGPGAP